MEASEPPRPATIYDVAARAGVSPSTVSRAFSRPGRVSSRTAEHIMAVAQELGYRAEGVTRPSIPSRTRMVGVVVSDVTNPFYFGIIRGAEAAAAQAGYSVVLIDAQESDSTERRMLDQALPVLDALVVGSSRLSDTELRRVARQVPVVVLNRQVAGLPCVLPDTASGVRHAVEHLAELGHRRITYVAGPPASWADGTRWRAVRETALELSLHDARLGPVAPTVRGGFGIAGEVAERGCTAVLAYNDLVAVGIMKGLVRGGVRVPDDVSIVGFDNTVVAELVSPGLTTVAAPLSTLGETATQAVLAAAESRKTAASALSVVPVKLVERESTARAR